MSFLIDTNILSEADRREGHPAVRAFLDSQPDFNLFVSVITFGEMQFGISRLTPGHRRDALARRLRELQILYRPQALPIDERVASVWGMVAANAMTQDRAR